MQKAVQEQKLMPKLGPHRNIYRYNIALLQGSVIRNAMTSNVVHTTANAFGKAFIVQGGRVAIMVYCCLMSYLVEVVSSGSYLRKGQWIIKGI